MYGTLSFNKSNQRSSPEFNAFSTIHGRRQRQSACDECRIARVKCREKPGKDACARCHGTGRTCTYNSSRRRRQPAKTAEPKELPRSPIKTGNSAEEDDRHDAETPSVADLDITTPADETTPPRWMDIVQGCQFDSLDFLGGLGEDASFMDVASPTVAAQLHLDGDPDRKSRPLNDFDLTTTTVEDSQPNNFDFRALLDSPFPQLFQAPPSPSPTPTPSLIHTTADRHGGYRELSNSSLDTYFSNLLSSHVGGIQDNTPPPSLAGLHVADLMEFTCTQGQPSSTPVAKSCTCLQDLTVNLFVLRTRGGDMPVDRFLLLFKQAMRKLQAVDTCASQCCVSQSTALLMFMNIQQLVPLVLEAYSKPTCSRESISILEINIGSFAVEDGPDQRLLSQIILASRIKELASFVKGICSKSRMAGLNDVHVEYQHQLDLLSKAFAV